MTTVGDKFDEYVKSKRSSLDVNWLDPIKRQVVWVVFEYWLTEVLTKKAYWWLRRRSDNAQLYAAVLTAQVGVSLWLIVLMTQFAADTIGARAAYELPLRLLPSFALAHPIVSLLGVSVLGFMNFDKIYWARAAAKKAAMNSENNDKALIPR